TAASGVMCKFRTCAPVTLWPISVEFAGFVSTDKFDDLDLSSVATVLQLTLRAHGDGFGALDLQRLRFYIDADPVHAAALYEILHPQGPRLAGLADGQRPQRVGGRRAIVPVGFADNEALLPFPEHAHAGFRLLQEYFTLPEKFLFFDLQNIDFKRGGETLDIL